MRRSSLYSSSKPNPQVAGVLGAVATKASDSPKPSIRSRLSGVLKVSPSDPRLLWSVIALMAVLLLLSLSLSLRPGAPKLTQEIIDGAVLKTLETADLPSPAARAYEAIIPAVVHVVSYAKSKDGTKDERVGSGTGVVIVDKGIILTNLHVVQGAQSIKVTFSDGMEATASVTGTQPENDLAVLQAHKIPDDMIAAAMRSTADLRPGD